MQCIGVRPNDCEHMRGMWYYTAVYDLLHEIVKHTQENHLNAIDAETPAYQYINHMYYQLATSSLSQKIHNDIPSFFTNGFAPPVYNHLGAHFCY